MRRFGPIWVAPADAQQDHFCSISATMAVSLKVSETLVKYDALLDLWAGGTSRTTGVSNKRPSTTSTSLVMLG